eukprot:Platyproteum_vivax@DN4856_c0_g1_i1.p1
MVVPNFLNLSEEMAIAYNDIPPFASEQVRNLNDEVLNNELLIQDVNLKIVETNERVKVMEDHLKNVEREIENLHVLGEAKNKELEENKHEVHLLDREQGRLDLDQTTWMNAVEDTSEQTCHLQREILLGNEKLNLYRIEMNWNQEELERWKETGRQKEDDLLALQKYKSIDQAKIKELNMMLEKLCMEKIRKETLLAEEISESKTQQLELDKVVSDLHKCHARRRSIIDQWSSAVKKLERMDHDLQKAGEAHTRQATSLAESRAQLAQLDEAHKRSETQSGSLMSGLKEEANNYAKAQNRLTETKQQLNDEEANSMKLRSELAAVALRVLKAKQLVVESNETLGKKKKKLLSCEKELEAFQQKVNSAKATASRKEMLSKEADKVYEEMQALLKNKTTQKLSLEQEVSRNDRLEIEVQNKLKRIENEVAGERSLVSKVQSEIRGSKARTEKVDDLLYKVDLQRQRIEREVARAAGFRSKVEEDKLKIELENVKREAEDIEGVVKVVEQEIKALDIENKKGREEETGLTSLLKKREEKEMELKLEIDRIELETGFLLKVKEEEFLKETLLRLQVDQLHKQLGRTTQSVFDLEAQKELTKIEINETESQIRLNLDMLKMEKRLLDEENMKTSKQLKESKVLVDKQRKKYESILARRGREDKFTSVAGVVLKIKKERAGFQQEEEELDEKIAIAQKELAVLYEGKMQIDACNNGVKKRAEKTNEQVALLMEGHKEVTSKLRRTQELGASKQKRIEDTMNKIKTEERTQQEFTVHHQQLLKFVESLRKQLEKITHDELELQKKIKRAKSGLKEADKPHRLMADIEGLKVMNEHLMRTCTTSLSQDRVNELLQTLSQHGITLPTFMRPASSSEKSVKAFPAPTVSASSGATSNVSIVNLNLGL